MLCELCGIVPATRKIRITLKGENRELDVCQKCASKYDLDNPFTGLPDALSILFLGLVADVLSKREKKDDSIRCSRCGTALADFRRHGSLGCAHCYEAFHEVLLAMLRRIHGSTKHIGTRPAARRYRSAEVGLQELRIRLKRAIEQEEYESAAELRDKIHDLENQRLSGDE